MKIYREIKKIIRLLFSEVGIIRSKLNYAINYLIYFKYNRNINNSNNQYKYFDKNKFLETGFSKFKFFNFTIDEYKILIKKSMIKKMRLLLKTIGVIFF